MIKTIHESFSRKGVKYTQVYSNDEWYIYRCEAFAYNDVPYYEVFKKVVVDEKINTEGKWVKTGELTERYPSDSDFGNWAWCCMGLARCSAMMKKHSKDVI